MLSMEEWAEGRTPIVHSNSPPKERHGLEDHTKKILWSQRDLGLVAW